MSFDDERARALEGRLTGLESDLAAVTAQNQRLVATLREARDQIVTLKEEVDRLAEPPSGYAVFLEHLDDGSVDISTAGRKMRVTVSPNVDAQSLRPGMEVMLNESMNIVGVRSFERHGEIVTLKEVLEGGDRALVMAHADEER
ncbi:MAG: proteasome ATPase, partial [Actinobacteria bacterium]|nr:proteasome ATPase [Actinomycetota bacterium]